MNVLDIFSGIGGFSLGLERAGMRTVAFCEIRPFCRAVLAGHWPSIPCYDDVRTLTAERLRADGISVDAICGGFPCQNVSIAASAHGGGSGLDGEQSGLWSEYDRLIGEIKPKIVIIENVDRLIGNGLDRVLRSLAGRRYDAEWDILPAWLLGLPQARKRVWIVAYPAGERMEGLFESIRAGGFRQRWPGSSPDLFDISRAPFGGDDRFPQPLLCGMDDRPSHWMDRLHACGNAVVPQIPEIIGKAIMTAAAAKISAAATLRNAAGEPPLGSEGAFFRDDQGCIFRHPVESYRSGATDIGILELDNGEWLAKPPSFAVNRPRYPNRELALRAAIAAMIRRARKYMRNKDGEGTKWSEGFAGRVIEWVLSIKEGLVQSGGNGADAECDHQISEVAAASDVDRVIEDSPSDHSGSLNQTLPDNNSPAPAIETRGGTGDDCSVGKRGEWPPQGGESSIRELSGIGSELVGTAEPGLVVEDQQASANTPARASDPIVAELVAAHRARKTYPAGHTFSMTNPVLAGAIKTVGTCSCSHIFVFPGGDHERMDAAIEAHWQKFDASPDKVDGRGNPIGGEAPTAPAKKPRKKKTTSAPEGLPAPTPAPSVLLDTDGAGASDVADAGPHAALRTEPAPHAPVGAGSLIEEPAPIGAPSLALSMAAEPADDWSPLLSAALDMAWREPPPVSDVQRALLDFGKVYALPRKVERPVLRWHGGKWKLAPWIISHFPSHKVYIEPFGGAGSVLLQKLPAITEVWNDLEGELVNLFVVLRNNAVDLARLVYLTPYSREEFHSLYAAADNPIERARRFVARSFMGNRSKGALRNDGFDCRINASGHDGSRVASLRAVPEELLAVAERFHNVIIEQKPAAEIFAQYDRPDVLFYVDPPYLSDRAKHYTHELDEAGHVALLETLRGLEGMAVVSGYRSELYDKALADWRWVEIDAHADGGIDRVEVVWLNPACTAALDQQMPALFDLAAHDVANTPPHGCSGS